MRAFEYASPSTREEVAEILQKYKGDAAVLAGGTDLLSLMKADVEAPSVVVDLKSVSGMSGVSGGPNGSLVIGALTTLDELASNPSVQSKFMSLVQAVKGVRSSQIRSRGTVGGDLCQRPRCWYYRNGYGLLPMHDGKSMVVEGDNRYHAILGSSDRAYFVNPSSLAPALVTLGARVKIFGTGGEREVGMADFFRVPATEGEREYDLKTDEIVVSVTVPDNAGSLNATYEVRQREILDWPLVAAAVSLKLSGKQVEDARIALGHVAPVPWLAADAGAILRLPVEQLTDADGHVYFTSPTSSTVTVLMPRCTDRTSGGPA